MKFTFKLFCSMLTGVLSGYCMPYLLMFAMNISKGNGVNSDGEMFQLPAIILIVMVMGVCIVVLKKLSRRENRLKSAVLIGSFFLSFLFLLMNGINILK